MPFSRLQQHEENREFGYIHFARQEKTGTLPKNIEDLFSRRELTSKTVIFLSGVAVQMLI